MTTAPATPSTPTAPAADAAAPGKVRRKNPVTIDMPSSVIAFCEIFGGTAEEFVVAAANRVIAEYRSKLQSRPPSSPAPAMPGVVSRSHPEASTDLHPTDADTAPAASADPVVQ